MALSRLKEHRFRHNFQDYMNPLYSCSLEIKGASHYLVHCHHRNDQRIDLMTSVKSVCHSSVSMSDNNKKYVLLYGDFCFDENKNKFFLEANINYIKNSERFNFWIMLFLLSWKMSPCIPYLNHLNHLLFCILLVNILVFPWRLRILSSGVCCMLFCCFLFFVYIIL